MSSYRVKYARSTRVELYVDVEAVSPESAKQVAATLLEDGDDPLVELPETYTSGVEPTGEVEEVEEGLENA